MTAKMEVGETIECRIDGNAYGGDGIARVDGMVVFVKGAFKGETVKARIRQVKKRFAKADFVELVDPSAEIPRRTSRTPRGYAWRQSTVRDRGNCR